MRLFFALWPDADTRERVANAAAALRLTEGARPVPQRNFHLTLAFVGAVISETVASNEGIGFLMMTASSRFEVPLLFAGLTVIAVMAVVAYVVCEMVETRLTHWAFRGDHR